MGDVITMAEKARVEVEVVQVDGKAERKRGPKWKEGENYKTGSSARTEGMEVLIEWLVTPESEREPRFKQELADALGVTPRTIRNWEKEPYVQRAVSSRTRGLFKVEKASAVVAALYETAVDVGNSRQVAAAKVFLDWTDKAEAELSADDLAELSNAEIAELLAEFHDMVLERDE